MKSHHADGEVVVEIVGAKSSRSSVRVWGVDLHLVLRLVEHLNIFKSKACCERDYYRDTFEGAPMPAMTSCTESPNLSRVDW